MAASAPYSPKDHFNITRKCNRTKNTHMFEKKIWKKHADLRSENMQKIFSRLHKKPKKSSKY